jgi:hypothetical protein
MSSLDDRRLSRRSVITLTASDLAVALVWGFSGLLLQFALLAHAAPAIAAWAS